MSALEFECVFVCVAKPIYLFVYITIPMFDIVRVNGRNKL